MRKEAVADSVYNMNAFKQALAADSLKNQKPIKK